MKKLTVLLIAVVTALFAGCASTGVQISPIGFEAAKAAALEAAGIEAATAVFGENELKEYNGQQYYEVDFRANGNKYEYDIDALTGAVIASETDVKASQPAEKSQDNQPSVQPQQKAETKTEDKSAAQKAELIGEEKAKDTALSHAGVKAADAKFVRTELDRDDGRTVYEVEFYSGNTEYDYDIDAYSGAVLAYDHDAENYSKPEVKQENKPAPTAKPEENKPQQSVVSEADAKKTALAQVPGAKESDIREFEVDRDDGRIEYEGKIVYDGLEYEFEIDGHSGAIRNWEVEKFEKYDD